MESYKVMLENIKGFCERLDYDPSNGYWLAVIALPDYFESLEIYIAGDANGLNPTLEKAVVRVLNNFSTVESTVKAYLVNIKSGTFFKGGVKDGILELNDCYKTESVWDIMWLNFCDVDKPDQYEVVCTADSSLPFGHSCCLWIVTLCNDTPISHYGNFW
ncbi:hypothetical protein QUB70_07110 [Microcoleus sp. A003_D6]|uniref:hypothetical protein n=1 Tax=Microcoleus sp. A003_D6 TaxID=3055266 RepID=UPI002FD0F4F5